MQKPLTAEQEYVREFIPFVDFLADILGPSSEVVLNDLLDLNHSVVAIRNSHITSTSWRSCNWLSVANDEGR